METTNQTEVYLQKGSSHLTKIILYGIITAVMYFIFLRGDEINFQFFNNLIAFGSMGIILIFCIKICSSITGPAIGLILGIILFVIGIFKLDDFLVSKGIPLNDTVYNTIFSGIGLIWLAYHIIFAISNFRKYSILVKADFNANNPELLQVKTNPDYEFTEK